MKKILHLLMTLVFSVVWAGCYNDILDNIQKKNNIGEALLVGMLTGLPVKVNSSTNNNTDPTNNNSTNSILDTEDSIMPEHSIANVGSAINLQYNAIAANANPSYSYAWQLLYRPANSTAGLNAAASTATLTPDAEGYYIVRLTITNNGASVGTFYAYIGTPSVVHYVRAGAAGANNGSDWTNAWTSLPAALVRGHTYYVADGTYPPMYFLNTPQNDVIPIYIKKAIGSNHGTNTGWDTASMGSGQAVWLVTDPIQANSAVPSGYNSIPFILDANYIVIDGQVGTGNGSAERHGFKFSNQSRLQNNLYHNAFFVGDGINGNAVSLHHIKIKHCEMAQFGCDTTVIGSQNFFIHSMVQSVQYLLLHSCYIHDTPGVSIYLMNTTNSIIEYCYVARNHSDPVSHGEAVYTNPSCNNNIVRFSVFEDIEGTGIVVGKSGWEFYGNLAFYTPAYVNTPKAGRHAPGKTCNNFVGQGFFCGINDCKVYNNTVIGNNLVIANDPSNSDAGNLGFLMWGSNNIAYNNLFTKCYRMDISTLSVSDYNLFNNNRNVILRSGQEAHSEYTAASLYVDELLFDFHLNQNTTAGTALPAPYTVDMDGKGRGVNNAWSRGAFQY